MYKKLLRSVYYRGIEALRMDRRRLTTMPGERKITVLNFHRVSPEPSPYWPPMRPEVFRSAIKYVKDNFDVRTFAGLNGGYGDRPIAVISFDDGYYDFIEYALPVLDDCGLSVNMNVIPECAETGEPMWLVGLYDFLDSASVEEINSLHIDGYSEKLASGRPEDKLFFGLSLSRYLKNMPAAERASVWQPIKAKMDRSSFPRTRMMTTDDLLSIKDRVELGAHSYSHESMALESISFFEADLAKCKAYFQEKLGMPLTIYAFPNGSYRDEHIPILERSGVEHILLVGEAFATVGERAISRFTMYGETPEQARMQTVGF